MKRNEVREMIRIAVVLVIGALFTPMLISCSQDKPTTTEAKSTITDALKTDFEAQVEKYIRLFPYQETYEYVKRYIGDDPSKLNTWLVTEPKLIRAGEDDVVRTNNDTFYTMAFIFLEDKY